MTSNFCQFLINPPVRLGNVQGRVPNRAPRNPQSTPAKPCERFDRLAISTRSAASDDQHSCIRSISALINKAPSFCILILHNTFPGRVPRDRTRADSRALKLHRVPATAAQFAALRSISPCACGTGIFTLGCSSARRELKLKRGAARDLDSIR